MKDRVWRSSAGEMAERIREHDWSTTALGPVDGWSPDYRGVTDLLLASGFPMVALYGPDLVQVYNDGYRELMGSKHPLGLGQPTRDCWPEVWHINEPIYRRVLTGETLTFEDKLYPITRADVLKDAWFTLSYSPLHDEAGEASGVLVTVFETTQRVQAEAALRDREARFRALTTARSYALYRMSPDWSEMRQLDGQGFIADTTDPSRSWLERYIYPDDHAWVWQAIDQAIETKTVFELEHRVRRTDGSVGWTLSRAVPLLDESGQIAEWFGSASDVTARHDAEEQLAMALKAACMGTYSWSSIDRRMALSEMSCFLLGLVETRSSPIDHEWFEHIVPDDRERVQREFVRAAAEGSRFHEVYRVVRPRDGRIVAIEDFGSGSCDSATGIAQVRGVQWDVTERESAHAALEQRVDERTAELQAVLANLHAEIREREAVEKQLRQSEKLKAIGQLTGGIAHDFNNMLQGVVSGLSLIRTRLAQGRSSDAERYIQGAEKAAAKASQLTSRLLAFSRQQTLNPQPVSLNHIVRGMEDLIRRTVGTRVDVEVKCAASEWLILCDPNELENALLNLCINARDAMHDGGWLTISTEERQLSATDIVASEAQQGRFAVIAVTDTGTGMSAETASHVFEPFFTTKPIGQGTGLGLSQIHGFVQQSGGVVLIETALGSGTTMRLCFPTQFVDVDGTAAPVQTGKTILLVEDEQEVRMLVADQLRDHGYRVIEASAGAEALRLLNTGTHIDLLITDVALSGGMNGREMVDAMRKTRRQIPVIFVTGFAGEESLANEDVVRKPFEMAALAQLVAERVH